MDTTLSYFQSKLREMDQAKEELECAKGEIHIFHEKFAKYEYDVSRYKKDISKACDEIEYLRHILKENNINIDAYEPLSKLQMDENYNNDGKNEDVIDRKEDKMLAAAAAASDESQTQTNML